MSCLADLHIHSPFSRATGKTNNLAGQISLFGGKRKQRRPSNAN